MSLDQTNLSKRVNNSLKAAAQYQLTRLVEKRAADFIGMTRGEIAANVASELGFRVTETNIRGVEDALGISFSGARKSSTAPHAEDIQCLANAVVRLYEQIGHPVPLQVAAIIRK